MLKRKKIKSKIIKKTAPSRPNTVPGGKKIHKLAITGKLKTRKLESFISRARKLGYPVKYSKPIGFKNARKKKKKIYS